MNSDFDFRIFKREDYPEYYSWFEDEDLNKRLGPMKEKDEEWLHDVLQDKHGCTYSVFQKEKLVAVIGIAFPGKDHPSYGITSIAVNPLLRSRGIGKRVLKRVMKLHSLKEGQYWIAHVDQNNLRAKLFFEKNGWKCAVISPENNNMFLLKYTSPKSNYI